MSAALEKHYRVKELAALWGFCDKTIMKMFADEPGVIRLSSGSSGKRRYVTLSIPESVALRVHERAGYNSISDRKRSGPRRIISWRDYCAENGIDLPPKLKPARVVKLKDFRARMAQKLPPS
jgi:hypothetical protein